MSQSEDDSEFDLLISNTEIKKTIAENLQLKLFLQEKSDRVLDLEQKLDTANEKINKFRRDTQKKYLEIIEKSQEMLIYVRENKKLKEELQKLRFRSDASMQAELRNPYSYEARDSQIKEKGSITVSQELLNLSQILNKEQEIKRENIQHIAILEKEKQEKDEKIDKMKSKEKDLISMCQELEKIIKEKDMEIQQMKKNHHQIKLDVEQINRMDVVRLKDQLIEEMNEKNEIILSLKRELEESKGKNNKIMENKNEQKKEKQTNEEKFINIIRNIERFLLACFTKDYAQLGQNRAKYFQGDWKEKMIKEIRMMSFI